MQKVFFLFLLMGGFVYFGGAIAGHRTAAMVCAFAQYDFSGRGTLQSHIVRCVIIGLNYCGRQPPRKSTAGRFAKNKVPLVYEPRDERNL